MKAQSFIRRLTPDPDGLDFEGLRQEGIRLVQELCGDTWTDYNLHDPGVTMLEQLCYGLTDLAYRSGFEVADYLATDDGSIDFGRQALYRPDEAFACGPVTQNDYRKLILDRAPNVDNAWIEKHPDVAGLYRVHLLLNERVKEQESAVTRRDYAGFVRNLYAASRNLCEDLDEVTLVRRESHKLCGEIEIGGTRSPVSVLAEIYFECAQYLSPKVVAHPYVEVHRQGKALEDLFSGILTRNGYIAEEELHPWRGQFSIEDLIGRISRIDGVVDVKHLGFDSGEADSITLDGERPFLSAACLEFPEEDKDIGISLYRAGKFCSVRQRDVATEFNRLSYKLHAPRPEKKSFGWLDELLPAGIERNVGEYYSVQNHFPDIYGINANGVPPGTDPEREAQAMRLKAYLLFFEQLMANFLQNAAQIPRLFSLDEQLRQSYFHRVLDNGEVPQAEKIYRHDLQQMDAELAALLAKFDDYGDRRNRVLDYLLGLYGEKFTQNSLRLFHGGEAGHDEFRIANKIAFMKDIVNVGSKRAAAFNYLKPGSGNVTGLQRKLEMLLGLQPEQESFRMVEHILLRPRSESGHTGHEQVAPDFYSSRLSLVFPVVGGNFGTAEFRKLVEETIYLNCPAHIAYRVLWLDELQMASFVAVHESWLEAMRDRNATPETIDAAAGALILSLLAGEAGNV